jgi:hypothetical protein
MSLLSYAELPDFGAMLAELERLLREEKDLSAARRRLHDLIDVGFANEVTLARERQISDERLALHRRIAELQLELRPVLRDPLMPLAERRLHQLGL